MERLVSGMLHVKNNRTMCNYNENKNSDGQYKVENFRKTIRYIQDLVIWVYKYTLSNKFITELIIILFII